MLYLEEISISLVVALLSGHKGELSDIASANATYSVSNILGNKT